MKHGWIIVDDAECKWFYEHGYQYCNAIEDAMVFRTRKEAREEKRMHEKIRKVSISITVKIIPGR